MGCFLDELVQHLVGDVFNHVGGQLVDEPGQHLLLVGQIAVVETGDFVLKVDERRDVIDAVFPGHVVVVDLDEGDPFAVALVVNVLQLGQDPLRLFGVVVVCPPQREIITSRLNCQNTWSVHRKRLESVNLQKRTARCGAVLVSVSNVLAVTSSIMSSSSLAVFLFCTSHSRTSSSRNKSPS